MERLTTAHRFLVEATDRGEDMMKVEALETLITNLNT